MLDHAGHRRQCFATNLTVWTIITAFYFMNTPKTASVPVNTNAIAQIVGGWLNGDPNALVSNVSHDSRQAKPGSLFAAVRGELFDAHKFIPQVMQQGAVGVMSELERPIDFS